MSSRARSCVPTASVHHWLRSGRSGTSRAPALLVSQQRSQRRRRAFASSPADSARFPSGSPSSASLDGPSPTARSRRRAPTWAPPWKEGARNPPPAARRPCAREPQSGSRAPARNPQGQPGFRGWAGRSQAGESRCPGAASSATALARPVRPSPFASLRVSSESPAETPHADALPQPLEKAPASKHCAPSCRTLLMLSLM